MKYVIKLVKEGCVSPASILIEMRRDIGEQMPYSTLSNWTNKISQEIRLIWNRNTGEMYTHVTKQETSVTHCGLNIKNIMEKYDITILYRTTDLDLLKGDKTNEEIVSNPCPTCLEVLE